MKTRASKYAFLSSAAMVALASSPAYAQTGRQPSEVGEVVVTALRREQALQDVPAAISVISGDNIKSQGAQDFRDYLTTLPGVNFTEGPLGGMRVTIRGVSDGVGGSDPLAGIYIDETPITESFFATLDPDVYDLERVEVLRGPQGTLYGASSMGGTVRIITKKPVLNVFEGRIEGRLSDTSHGGTNKRIDGVLNVPLVDDLLALRMSAGYRRDAGWIDNVALGKNDVNTVEKTNARLQLLLAPSDDTSVILGFTYQKDELGIGPHDDVALPDYKVSRFFAPNSESEAKLVALTVRQSFEKLSLTSATNYLSKDVLSGSDSTTSANLRANITRLFAVAPGATEALGTSSASDYELFNQEFRIASAGENRLDYVVGAFYSNGSAKIFQTNDFTQSPTLRNAGVTGLRYFTFDQEYTLRQIAGFGELTFNATENLALTVGLRVFNVEQKTITVNGGLLNGAGSYSVGKSSATAKQQKYLAQYTIDPDKMLYAQASQGYRNGAPTGNGLRAECLPELASLGYSGFPTEYGPDKLWNYEVGSKNTLLDGRMTLNGAVYYLDWSDIQSSVRLACGSGFVANAGKAVSKGFEVESTLQPIQGLSLTGALSYADAELKEVAAGQAGVRAGDPLPATSKWSWNLGVQYNRPLTDSLTGYVGVDANHVGSRWSLFRSAGPNAVLLPSYTLVNARVGVNADRWSAGIFVSNLFDERYVNNRSGTPTTGFDFVGRPRIVGVNARFGF